MSIQSPSRQPASLKENLSSRILPMDGDKEIPIDSEYGETVSEISAFDETSRASLASSLTQYRYENGRRYHAYREGQYWAPNDDQSSAVDTIAHHIFLLTFNDKLFLAPLNKPRRALDIGCGNGIWTTDFADRYPETEITGTDLSPIQPQFTPPNLRFEIDDCCSAWVYPENHFDYIHIRMMFASVADWPALYRECYKHLAPGGYIEHAEVTPVVQCDDDSIPPGSLWLQQNKLAVACGEAFGKTIVQMNYMKDQITAAGFVDVVEVKYKWPIGPWSNEPKLKDLGRWNMHMWEQGIEGWTMALLTRYMHWSYDRVKEFVKQMRAALLDRKVHAYQEMRVVYARKPLSPASAATVHR